MANQHFVLDLTKPHALKLAKLVRKAEEVLNEASNLKSIADEVTGGGATLDATDYIALFGLPDSTAGAALYPMLQSLMGGSVVTATIVEFDQGL